VKLARLKKTMSRSLTTIAFAGIAAMLAAGGEKQPITLFVEPSASAYEQAAEVTVKLTITNNGPGEISFLTCEDLGYAIDVEDSHGVAVPKSTPAPPTEKEGELARILASLPECGRNILVTLRTGKSWIEMVSLVQYIDLKSPGSYTGRIILLPGKLSADKVSSNSFQFTVRAKPQK
jgi:hypothetical protein